MDHLSRKRSERVLPARQGLNVGTEQLQNLLSIPGLGLLPRYPLFQLLLHGQRIARLLDRRTQNCPAANRLDSKAKGWPTPKNIDSCSRNVRSIGLPV